RQPAREVLQHPTRLRDVPPRCRAVDQRLQGPPPGDDTGRTGVHARDVRHGERPAGRRARLSTTDREATSMANPARSTTAANPYHQPLGPVSDLVATTTPRPA